MEQIRVRDYVVVNESNTFCMERYSHKSANLAQTI
jgi:hypothetical protein